MIGVRTTASITASRRGAGGRASTTSHLRLLMIASVTS